MSIYFLFLRLCLALSLFSVSFLPVTATTVGIDDGRRHLSYFLSTVYGVQIEETLFAAGTTAGEGVCVCGG